MASPTQSRLPIPDEVIARRKWRARLTSPITWGNLLVLGLLSWFLKWPAALVVGLFVVALLGLAFYWRLTGKALEKRILKQLITKTNTKQLSELSQRAQALQRAHAGDLAITLGRFIELKQELESEMHQRDEVPEGAADVEHLVDTLCVGVADELERLAHVQGRLARPDLQVTEAQTKTLKDSQRELVQRISDAYKTLAQTHGNLDAILRPISLDAPQQKIQLAEVITKLKEETEIARRVRQRLDEQQAS